MKPTNTKINVKKEYTAWCKKIADKNSDTELIRHFRAHVNQHFNRHNKKGRLGFIYWLTDCFNFLDIFKEKYKISDEDLLFKLCMYLKTHNKGPIPSFDIDKFIENHKSLLKDYCYNTKLLK